MQPLPLWYVCKRLCNGERVDALRKVMTAPEPMSVSQTAEMLRLKEPATCQYLAQLELDCGLIVSERFGRYVTYRPDTESSSARSRALVRLFSDYFHNEMLAQHLLLAVPQKAPSFVNALPALSNEGRVKICLHLRKTHTATIPALKHLLGQCEAGIRRHLNIIACSGFGTLADAVFSWLEPSDPILKTLLDLLQQETPSLP